MTDVIVIGGGPAGTSSAIHLAQQGHQVMLYEKAMFPRAKLCGGFLSSESVPEFKALGVWDELLRAGADVTTRVLVSSSKGTTAECDLRLPALSLSRKFLDDLLLQRARAVGVDVRTEDGTPYQKNAPWTVIASGRKPPLQATASNAFYGFQAFFENVDGLSDQIELDMVPGGYVGLARQDGQGAVNVCGLLTGKTMHRMSSDLDAGLRQLCQSQPLLQKRLGKAQRTSGWKTVGPVVMGLRRLTEPRAFFVGDAACVVDPFAGEGVSMGLIGGRLIAQALLQNPTDPLSTYERIWHRQFDGSIRLQRAICWAIASPLWQEFLVVACRRIPLLMRWLTNGTRAPEFSTGSIEPMG